MLSSPDLSDVISRAIAEHLTVVHQLKTQQGALQRIAAAMSHAVATGHTIFWLGNGGSAADAQHLAAELVGRFRLERRPIASVALTTDTSVLTAIANDYGYDELFSRQLQALCSPDDIVVGISTSGNSVNVCSGLQTARALGAFTVGLTGESGGRLASISDVCVRINSSNAARVQEAHILCGHIFCELLESAIGCAQELTAVGGAR
jgi:D-sedoheptulose 7-phosphate isomerase